MRLIDLDSVGVGRRTASMFLKPESATGWNELLSLLEKQESIDPVCAAGGVYCRECVFSMDNTYCKNHNGLALITEFSFCPYGQKKIKEDNDKC